MLSAHDWWTDPKSEPYHDALIQGAAQSNGAVTPFELAQQIGQESGFDPNAKSSTSTATGIAQILSGTAKDPGYGIAAVDPTNANASIIFAGKYDGAVGVSGYSGGNYTKQDLDNSMSGATPTDTSTSDEGLFHHVTSAVTSAAGSAVSGAVQSVAVSSAKGIFAYINEYGTRLAIIVLGLVFIAVSLVMLAESSKTVQSIQSTAIKAVA